MAAGNLLLVLRGLFHCLCDAISELLSVAKTPFIISNPGRKHF